MTTSSEVTVTAPAVIKYWGKRDSQLMLPTNSSLSLTLNQDHLCTTTTLKTLSALLHLLRDTWHLEEIANKKESPEDTLWINGIKQDLNKRFVAVLTAARQARSDLEATNPTLSKISKATLFIASLNNFPTAAGLASSASGFAALAFALSQLFELPVPLEQVSGLARLGSGSASRSLFGGFVKWEMGVRKDGTDSLASQVATEHHWPLAALVLVVSDTQKETSSTAGMQNTVNTSPLFAARLAIVPQRMKEMEAAINARDFDAFAELTMKDSDNFHAVCLDTYPSIAYMNDVSRGCVRAVNAFNKKSEVNGKGYKACYTFDAGPNCVVYLRSDDVIDFLKVVESVFPGSNEGSVIAESVGIKPFPAGSLKRIIKTCVGGGPQLISRKAGDKCSLLRIEENSPLLC